MSPEKQQIAILQACGWRKEYIHGNGMDCEVWIHPDGKQCWPEELAPLPRYLSDLNAMHEAEKVFLKSDEDKRQQKLRADYRNELFVACELEPMWHATAAQRAEAFLKTIGKWEESPRWQDDAEDGGESRRH